jgi:glycine dehydrogenase subunit 1
MEVSNASHYDGATSLAEAIRLTLDLARGQRRKVVLSPALHPQYRQVVRTYLRGSGVSVSGDEDPTTDIEGLQSLVDDQTAALVIQNPNFFGQFEDVRGLSSKVHDAGASLIAVVDPISLGLFQAPGTYGADVAVADGQSLGLPLSFGGPHLGIFATRKSYVRRLAGRLVGETVDAEGKRGYVLTLGTREQHIRRAKATSNICTNAALTALGAAVYLATMGKSGLRQIAKLCFDKSHYAAVRIGELPGLQVNPQASGKAFFKEFVVALPRPVDEVNKVLLDGYGIIGGYDLGQDYPHLDRHMLIAVTEMNTRSMIDRLVDGMREATA